MKISDYIYPLHKCMMFQNFDIETTIVISKCFNMNLKKYSDQEFIWMSDDDVTKVGIIVSGEALVIKDDIMGNRIIISPVRESETFNISFVCAGIKKAPLSVVSKGECIVVFMDIANLISPCENVCAHHSSLIQNILKILAHKNINLNNKLSFISKKTLKNKVAAFLLHEYENNNNNPNFTISFDRNDLANFLCTDRSALSRELALMKKNNLIDFKKNNFLLKDIKTLCELSA